jgi:hypothetical protein
MFERVKDSIVNRALSVQAKHFEASSCDSGQHHSEVFLLANNQLALGVAIPRRRLRAVPILLN